MQVLCMATADLNCDVQCPCCNQKYAIYYSRQSRAECDEARVSVLAALVAHHALNPSVSAHPADAFTVPAWNGPLHTCAAALLGGAPLRAAVASCGKLPVMPSLVSSPSTAPSPMAPLPISLVPPNMQQRRVS